MPSSLTAREDTLKKTLCQGEPDAWEIISWKEKRDLTQGSSPAWRSGLHKQRLLWVCFPFPIAGINGVSCFRSTTVGCLCVGGSFALGQGWGWGWGEVGEGVHLSLDQEKLNSEMTSRRSRDPGPRVECLHCYYLHLKNEEMPHPIGSFWNVVYAREVFLLIVEVTFCIYPLAPMTNALSSPSLRHCCINWFLCSQYLQSDPRYWLISFVSFSIFPFVWSLNSSVPQISPFTCFLTLLFVVCLRFTFTFKALITISLAGHSHIISMVCYTNT